jgi:hypothetical protein
MERSVNLSHSPKRSCTLTAPLLSLLRIGEYQSEQCRNSRQARRPVLQSVDIKLNEQYSRGYVFPGLANACPLSEGSLIHS